MGGEHLVADEDVTPLGLAPGGVGASDETRPAHRLDLAVKRVQIVLELGDQLRVLGAAALDSVPHVEDHQAVVPVAQIGQAVLHVDVVQHPPRGPAEHPLGLQRVRRRDFRRPDGSP